MFSTRTRFLVLSGVLAALLASQVLATTAKTPNVLEWDTMIGLPATLTGQSIPALRNVTGAGAAWTLTSAKGSLSTSGKLKIEVVGLVVASSGSNPANAFRVNVSCVNANGTFTNVAPTDTFPATTGLATAGGGNSDIEITISLPNPCIAPIVFVTSTGGNWFAATGR